MEFKKNFVSPEMELDAWEIAKFPIAESSQMY